MDFTKSRALQKKSHALIPGGCHTYAKGDDQFPELAPGFIARGEGCHVWDVDGNEFIEYGMGCRAVTLGHGYPAVVEAARSQMSLGANFTRPAEIEVECAEELLGMIEGADMVKFAKDGSSATTAALKLARAHTGRDMVAICADHPFFSVHDWFIGSTTFDAGVPQVVKDLTVSFRYNDIASVREMFTRYSGQIAGLIMEPAKYEDPADRFLHETQALCQENGAVFIFDEMITGFRWHIGGAQKVYDITPDLSTFGKAMGNGFSISALVGKRELMELGGLQHDKERVFLLSTTHGAETHALAAGIETMRTYQRLPIIETLDRQGARLAKGLRQAIDRHELSDFVQVFGKPCSMVFSALDQNKQRSQEFRTLLLQETIRRGVLAPSLVVSYSHSDTDIDRTVDAFDGAFSVYRQALQDGIEHHLVGRASQVVYRKYNFPSVANDVGETTQQAAASANVGT